MWRTADLEGLSSAAQFQLAFHAWAPEPYAARAGFDLGFAYLLMPLYALSFFYSGVIVAEASRPAKIGFGAGCCWRRWWRRSARSGCGIERRLELAMLLGGADDGFARIAAGRSQAKTVAVMVGLALLVGALVARFEAPQEEGQ